MPSQMLVKKFPIDVKMLTKKSLMAVQMRMAKALILSQFL